MSLLSSINRRSPNGVKDKSESLAPAEPLFIEKIRKNSGLHSEPPISGLFFEPDYEAQFLMRLPSHKRAKSRLFCKNHQAILARIANQTLVFIFAFAKKSIGTKQ